LGRKPKVDTSAAAPQCPEELEYLWHYFQDLMMAITPGGLGPSSATWDNILSWSQLMRIALDPWEALMLARLSVSRANIMAEPETKIPAPVGVGKKK
jgi:hypothetical protein